MSLKNIWRLRFFINRYSPSDKKKRYMNNKLDELEAQIEKMKCCGNCSEPCWNPPTIRKSECLSNNYSLWKLADDL